MAQNGPEQLLDLENLWLPQEIIDSSDREDMLEYLKKIKDGQYKRQHIFIPENSRPINISVKLKSVNVDEVNKELEARAIESAHQSSKKLPARFKMPQNHLLRKTIDRPEKFSQAVASTPFTGGRQPLNASVSPIALTVLTPEDINRAGNKVHILEQIIIPPSDDTPCAPQGEHNKLPRNLSQLIENRRKSSNANEQEIPRKSHLNEVEMIPSRNENFERHTTDSSLITEDRSNEKESEPPVDVPAQLMSQPRRFSSSSGSSVGSALLDGFTESIVPEIPVALSPAAPSLLHRVLKEMTNHEPKPKNQTFVAPKPVRGKKKINSLNPDASSYFEISESQKYKMSVTRNKRQLYSQKFDSPSRDVLQTDTRVTRNIPDQPLSDTDHGNPPAIQTIPEPEPYRSTTKCGPSPDTRRTKNKTIHESPTKESSRIPISDLSDDQPLSILRRRFAESRGVQTSLEAPKKTKKSYLKKTGNERKPAKRFPHSPAAVIDSAEFNEGMRRSKRTRYYPSEGYWEAKVPIEEEEYRQRMEQNLRSENYEKSKQKKAKPRTIKKKVTEVMHPEPGIAFEAPHSEAPTVETANTTHAGNTSKVRRFMRIESIDNESEKSEVTKTNKKSNHSKKNAVMVESPPPSSSDIEQPNPKVTTSKPKGRGRLPKKQQTMKDPEPQTSDEPQTIFKVPDAPDVRQTQNRKVKHTEETSVDSGMQSECSNVQPTSCNQEVQINLIESHGLEWFNQLIQKGVTNNKDPNLDFIGEKIQVLSSCKDICVKEHKGVFYLSYCGGDFKDCGYIRMAPKTRKPRVHTGRYSLHLLLLCGNIEVIIDQQRVTATGGDVIFIKKGQKYSLDNKIAKEAFIWFNKQLDLKDSTA